MTQVSQQSALPPATPKAAAGRPAEVDRRLDTALFKALADPTRARLLSCLLKCRRPCSVSEVAECCSVDFSVVARHLALLARAGVLQAEKRGRTMWYAGRGEDLAGRLRGLADAIDECCGDGSCCGGIALPGDAGAQQSASACGCEGGACDADAGSIGRKPDATVASPFRAMGDGEDARTFPIGRKPDATGGRDA